MRIRISGSGQPIQQPIQQPVQKPVQGVVQEQRPIDKPGPIASSPGKRLPVISPPRT